MRIQEIRKHISKGLSGSLEIAGSKKAMRLYWAALSTLAAIAVYVEPSQAQQQLAVSFAIGAMPLMLAPDFVA